MGFKLLAILPLLLGVLGWVEAESILRNTTHNPVLPEGGSFPLRSGQLSLDAVNIYDDGSVVIPRAIQHLYKQTIGKGLCAAAETPAMCGTYELTTGQAITITTPNYPDNYPFKFKCSWKFKSADTEELSLTCEDFSLDKKKDFLSVKHTTSGTAKKYKNNNRPSVAQTTGGVLDLKFVSKKKQANRGFKCTIRHLGSTTTVPTTTTTSTTTTATTTTMTTTTTTTPPPLPLSHPRCGLVNTRIVNGANTAANEYPWMVWTHMKWSNGRQRSCGGTIIHEEWILTAAHCPYRLNDAGNALYYPNKISIKVGAHNRNNPGAHGGYSVDVDVNHIYINPMYQLPYDIALYKLKSPLVFTQNVAPVCLAPRAWAGDDLEGVPVTLSGWGKTQSGSLSTYLRDYSTVGYSYDSCVAYYGSWMGPTQMCTDGTARKHSCSGDSGGPVTRTVDGRVFQVGVISFGASTDCKDQAPDGQVRVAAFIDWFESITGLSFSI